MPDARIPALEPFGLGIVPGYRHDPHTDAEDPTWRADWFAWHAKMRDFRVWAQEEFARKPTFRDSFTMLCSRHPALFISTFLTINEPRKMEHNLDDSEVIDIEEALADDDWELAADLSYRTTHPYIPFAYQVEAWQLLTKVILGPLAIYPFDILWDKARGIGMSYCFLAWAYWAWLFVPGLQGTILTEKWDKAEKSHSKGTLFGKLDIFFNATPDTLIPEGFRGRGARQASRLAGVLHNPENDAAIFTETTTADSTRGDRDAYVGVDEFNFQIDFEHTWATIHGTTKHCLAWSSASWRHGRQGERAVKAARESPTTAKVIVLEARENPYQDATWEEQTREVFKSTGRAEQFDVEYMRNAAAGYGTLVYKAQSDMVPWTDEWYDPTRPLKASVDTGTEDYTAFVFWQTHYPEGRKVIRWLDAYQIDKLPVQFHAHVMTGIEPIQGDDCYPFLLEGYFEQGRIRHIMAWMRSVNPTSLYLYGDPTMKRRDVTHNSWVDYFERLTRELREREGVGAIPIYCTLPNEELSKRNNFHDRRVGLREALMISETSRNDGTAELREAWENTRFQEITERTTRPPGHLHDSYSHYVQASEFGMGWETQKGMTIEHLKPVKPVTGLKKGRGRKVKSNYQLRSQAIKSLAEVF